MNVSVKKWDFTDSGKSVDIPSFAHKFNDKHVDKDRSYLDALKKDIVAQVIRWQMAKARSGNASTKTRSDVSATTRKPWAQKETGKARQGSLVGPHFRGGGVAFGPHPRSYEYKLNKKYKSLALALILDCRFESQDVLVLDSFAEELSKTRDMKKWLDSNGLNSVLFVGNANELFRKSAANLYKVDVLPVVGINVLSCVKREKIILDFEALKYLLGRFSERGEYV